MQMGLGLWYLPGASKQGEVKGFELEFWKKVVSQTLKASVAMRAF